MDKEFVIGEDLETLIENNVLNIKSIRNPEMSGGGKYLGNNLYLGANTYTEEARYDYAILKYKVYQLINTGTYEQLEEDYSSYQIPTDTGYYYTVSYPIEKTGNLDLKIKYERG